MKTLEKTTGETCSQCNKQLGNKFYTSPYEMKYCDSDCYNLFTED